MSADQNQPFIDIEDKVSPCLSKLMITGSATPYLHNGIISGDTEDCSQFEVILNYAKTTLKTKAFCFAS